MIDQKLYSQGQALHIDKMILSKDLMWSYNLISQKKIIFNFRSIFNYFLTHWFQGPFKWPLSIFLSTGANLKIIEKKADLWGAKNWRPVRPETIFLDFLCWEELKVFFKTEKNFRFFFHFLATKIKAAPPPAVITIRKKIPREIFIYYVEKFKLLAQLVFS